MTARHLGLGCLVGGVIALAATPAPGDEPPEDASKQIERLKKLAGDAEKLGEWDQHYPIIEDATDNIFAQHDWDSEPDRFARELVRTVGRISPWKPHERSKAFLDGIQVRWGLTHDQRVSLNGDMRAESMKVAKKYFAKTLPVFMEAIRTRANGEPWTAEQVQRWSRVFKPLMNDSLRVVEEVVGRLEKTMTEDQRKKLEADLKALRKRHQDMEKHVEKWMAGNWNPTEWGLQNDPIHAGAMAEYRAAEEEKNRRVEDARDQEGLDEDAIATNESEWDKYVRLFCRKYECTDAQRTQANSILKSSKQEAITIRGARRVRIEQAEQRVKTAETPGHRKSREAEVQRLLAPIGRIFHRMKTRLSEQVLTSDQRKKLEPQLAEKPAGPRG